MFPIPGLSRNSVSFEALSGFPFDSPVYDPLQSNGLRCKQLLDTLRLSNQSIISYFELLNGEGHLFRELELDLENVARAIYHGLRYQRNYQITRAALENLSRELVVPIRFFEVLANNNGCYHALTTFNEDKAEYFHLFVKLPSSFLNSAIYFRHDLLREITVCLLFGNEIHRVESAAGQMFLPSRRCSTSPMQIVDTIMSEYVALMEPHRHSLDVSLRQLEAKTGMGAHEFHESQRELHVCEGQLAFFERTVQFQAGWIEWLQAQHAVLNQLRFGTRELISLPPFRRPVEEGVVSSLSLCASLSRESLEQARTLRNRVRIQLSVVANLISQNDSRTNIAIANASRRIGFETRRDSDAMKTIAALTMVFLPGTFVAVRTQLLFFPAKASDTRHV
ncbi:MAG: hypothetical protein LQ339_001834 [Xanthoria mediterranea]|nr:MAG: hypothetical protein LQ339_001834 [Xanthoria mediterranea]